MKELQNDLNNTLEILENGLKNGVVNFSFEKKDGSWRNAWGTRNTEIIETVDGVLPKGTGGEKTNTIAYWDLESCGWRALRQENLIDVWKVLSKEEFVEILREQNIKDL